MMVCFHILPVSELDIIVLFVCMMCMMGRPTIVGQGPTAFAVGAGGGCLDIFFSSILALVFLRFSGRRPDID